MAPIPLTEDEKLVRNLYLIYKSAKMCNLNLVERYAKEFDRLDLDGIQKLLKHLERIIQENEPKTSAQVAEQHCIEMYLNYLNAETVSEVDEATRQYIIDGFVAVNSGPDETARCQHCKFPLIVEANPVKYESFGENLVKYFWSKNQSERCFKVASRVPAMLNVILQLMANEKLNADLTNRSENLEANEKFVDILFACADEQLFERCIRQNVWFQSGDFWRGFLQRAIKLHHDGLVICIECQRLSPIDCITSFYSFEYLLGVCVEHVDGLTALNLCRKFAINIPGDALSKDFYLKCLIRS